MKIPPVRIQNVKKNLPLKPKTTPKIDLSGEENGYFKIGDKFVKIIFPRLFNINRAFLNKFYSFSCRED